MGGFNLKTDDEGLAVRYDSFSEGVSVFNEKQEEIYIVREGDTVSEIAEMFEITPETIIGANDLGEYVHKGQHLVILPFSGVRHQIKKDDTLSGIASKYDVSKEKIIEFNDISENKKLSAGYFIDVPGGVKERKSEQDTEDVSSSPVYAYNQTDRGVSAASSYFIRPVRGGVRTQGLHGRNAVDIAAPIGTPIYAAASGRVVVSGWHSSTGYGYYIVIDHPNGTSTLYSHNSENLVEVGEWVEQGDVIARMGSTGFSTGPHLHFEVHGAANPF